MAIKTVAKRCQDFRPPIFFERKGTFTLSPRYPVIGEENASVICPTSIISPASAAESSTTFMKNMISNESRSCRRRSLNTFPTAHDNRSIARILNQLYFKPVAFDELYKEEINKLRTSLLTGAV